MFQKKAIVATVAARPLAGLQQNPPELDLFIARAKEMEIDPAMEFVMIEERSGFYEADRHTLLALQKMAREPFPLSEHIVDVEQFVSPPQYVIDNPVMDLTSVLRNNKHETYEKVDIITRWPKQPASDLDASQLSALKRVLTKRLAIVQGPPGTGKTHVTVELLKVKLANYKSGDPPILIACQTNHALDQLLRHIAPLVPEEFVRLGGRSKDRDVIKKRTLHEVKQGVREPPLAGCLKPNARKKMKALEKEMALILSPLKPVKTPLEADTLQRLGVLTQKQAETLVSGASQWVQQERSNPNVPALNVWVGTALVAVPPKQLPEEFGFEFEEADLEFEQLKELEAETQANGDDEHEGLVGETFPIADNFTSKKPTGVSEAKQMQSAIQALKQQDMWKIPEPVRGAVYRYLQTEAKKVITTAFREKAEAYNKLALDRRTGLWEEHETILKKQKVVGMTTTGLSKYRGLLAALGSKDIVVEEAAETLEAPTAVACLPSLEQLILVGDHKQLRPHCHSKILENSPYYLNISLFERMVNNSVEYDTLSKQRRMIPEIRRILHPIYGNLITDHASVLDPGKRPNVPGMGGVNSFFFTHVWLEQRDSQMSAYNPDEADMIVGFVEYLHYNGVDTEDITVLTFYNGQRKRILTQLRKAITLQGCRFNVVTVDSYQGEENKIVLLSLVRNNDHNQIGFLGVENRVCVALSRAQCGFYLFGNGELLYRHNVWRKVLQIMLGASRKRERPQHVPSRVNDALEVRCSNHNKVTSIKEPSDWQKIVGGCQMECQDILPCGHACQLTCHPFSHDVIGCQQTCGKPLPCGHGTCENVCGSVCECKTCIRPPKSSTQIAKASPFDGQEQRSEHASPVSNAASWQSFAQDESRRYSSAVASLDASREASTQVSPQKGAEELQLLDLGEDNNARMEEEQMAERLHQLQLGLDGAGEVKKKGKGKERAVEEVVVAGGGSGRKKCVERIEPAELEQQAMVGAKDEDAAGHQKDWSKESMSLLD